MQQSPRPRPTPEFFEAPCFSHRKRTPNRVPPKAPVKSCPPVSRIFTSPHQRGARVVSFQSESHGEITTSTQVSSPHYNPSSRQPFFEQCFDVVNILGKGSFGEVFKVKSKEDGKLYAIKKSSQRFRGDIDRWRKLHEVEKHEKLSSHHNCIRFYKAWEERSHLYIMTELCLMSLAEYADLHGKLPEHRVWNVLLDLTQGLKHLHDNRLCHLDIKPANIFIGLDGFTCKLGDFGLTISIDTDLHDASEGDSRYIANELLKGKFSTAADIFSLGISLLELACDLELPSEGEGWHHLRKGYLPEQFISGLSESLVHLLSSMMDPIPDRRPTVDQILTNASLRKIALLRPFIKTSHTTGAALKFVYNRLSHWICTLFSVLFIVLRISPWRHTIHSPSSSSSTSHYMSTLPPDRSKSVSNISMDTTNNYFSDSDEELEALSRSFQNQSSQCGSPVSCKSAPIYYDGSPLPINFNQLRFSPTVRTSSPNNNRTEGRRTNMIKSINIGPRNLMDMFNESGDLH